LKRRAIFIIYIEIVVIIVYGCLFDVFGTLIKRIFGFFCEVNFIEDRIGGKWFFARFQLDWLENVAAFAPGHAHLEIRRSSSKLL